MTASPELVTILNRIIEDEGLEDTKRGNRIYECLEEKIEYYDMIDGLQVNISSGFEDIHDQPFVSIVSNFITIKDFDQKVSECGLPKSYKSLRYDHYTALFILALGIYSKNTGRQAELKQLCENYKEYQNKVTQAVEGNWSCERLRNELDGLELELIPPASSTEP
ncbi:hypothetical protein [Fodinicurvata sediminis]|uniref:hypothetical protein n=1 Tax=Fodinicurvata sediminis TaxID=1121832 RepID=UPI0003B55656|nr:hypothetical protein [Fodinicurvata sediminis]